MRVESIRIEHFRSFKSATIPLNEYTCLVGSNGAGKSTVLQSLNVFFREYGNLSATRDHLGEEDFHCKNTEKEIEITVTFRDLNDDAENELSH